MNAVILRVLGPLLPYTRFRKVILPRLRSYGESSTFGMYKSKRNHYCYALFQMGMAYLYGVANQNLHRIFADFPWDRRQNLHINNHHLTGKISITKFEVCIMVTTAFVGCNSTRNIAFGKLSTTLPSNSITSSFAFRGFGPVCSW